MRTRTADGVVEPLGNVANVPDDSVAIDEGTHDSLLPEGDVGSDELVESVHVYLGSSEELIALTLVLIREAGGANKGTVGCEARSEPQRQIAQVHHHSYLGVGPLVQDAVEDGLPALGDEGQEEGLLG